MITDQDEGAEKRKKEKETEKKTVKSYTETRKKSAREGNKLDSSLKGSELCYLSLEMSMKRT